MRALSGRARSGMPAMTDFSPGRRTKAAALLLATLLGAAPAAAGGDAPARTLNGAAAFGDWTTDAPGTRRRIIPTDLPPPGATPSASNSPRLVPRPADAWPKVPPGFAVDVFAEQLEGPREMRVAPNGDIFVAEGQAGRI